MSEQDDAGSSMNDSGTGRKIGTSVTQWRSRGVRKHAGYVYFIRVGDHIKIGFSTRPIDRLNGLQTSNPGRLEIVGTRPGSRKTEAELHERFKDMRVRGEWFQARVPLLRFIESNTIEGLERTRARGAQELDGLIEPTPIRKRGDPATISWLIALRTRFGANTPIGHRCSNMAELEDNIANANDAQHEARLKVLRAKQGRELMNLLAVAA